VRRAHSAAIIRVSGFRVFTMWDAA